MHVAAKPADADHPYGHDKAEFFAAVITGVMIVVAALSILEHAWESWQNPAPIAMPVAGIAVNAAATVLNVLWGVAAAQDRPPAAVAGADSPTGGTSWRTS